MKISVTEKRARRPDQTKVHSCSRCRHAEIAMSSCITQVTDACAGTGVGPRAVAPDQTRVKLAAMRCDDAAYTDQACGWQWHLLRPARRTPQFPSGGMNPCGPGKLEIQAHKGVCLRSGLSEMLACSVLSCRARRTWGTSDLEIVLVAKLRDLSQQVRQVREA